MKDRFFGMIPFEAEAMLFFLFSGSSGMAFQNGDVGICGICWHTVSQRGLRVFGFPLRFLSPERPKTSLEGGHLFLGVKPPSQQVLLSQGTKPNLLSKILQKKASKPKKAP